MNRFKNMGIRKKYAFLVGIYLIIITILLFASFPLLITKESNSHLKNQAVILGSVLSHSFAVNLAFEDINSINASFSRLKDVPNINSISFFIVSKSDGTVFNMFNKENAEAFIKNNIKIDDYKFVEWNQNLITTIPVELNKERVGSLTLAYSKKEINESLLGSGIIVLLIGLIVIGFGIYFFFMITKKIIYTPIISLTEIAQKISCGDTSAEVVINSNDEIGVLQRSFSDMVDSIKHQSFVAEEIANGNLIVEVKTKSDNDALSQSLKHVIQILNGLLRDLSNLTRNSINGNLSVRANPDKYKGDYKKIIEELNLMLDSALTPVQEGIAVLHNLTKGNFKVHVENNYLGDHKLLNESINDVASSLNSTYSNLHNSIVSAAQVSDRIYSGTQYMVESVNAQDLQISQIASAVNLLTDGLRETKERSILVTNSSQLASSSALSGEKVIKETIERMKHIESVVANASISIKELGGSSEKINNIAQVINDIADQTNLLALNAAIEAARAGEQGRGFAVVADEVKKLAEKTSKATKEISEIIKKIRLNTNDAIHSIRKGTEEVEQGLLHAENSEKSLHNIVESIYKVDELAVQMDKASKEQLEVAEGINENIEQLSFNSKTNLKGIEQNEKSAEDINKIVSTLKSMLAEYDNDLVELEYLN